MAIQIYFYFLENIEGYSENLFDSLNIHVVNEDKKKFLTKLSKEISRFIIDYGGLSMFSSEGHDLNKYSINEHTNSHTIKAIIDIKYNKIENKYYGIKTVIDLAFIIRDYIASELVYVLPTSNRMNGDNNDNFWKLTSPYIATLLCTEKEIDEIKEKLELSFERSTIYKNKNERKIKYKNLIDNNFYYIKSCIDLYRKNRIVLKKPMINIFKHLTTSDKIHYLGDKNMNEIENLLDEYTVEQGDDVFGVLHEKYLKSIDNIKELTKEDDPNDVKTIPKKKIKKRKWNNKGVGSQLEKYITDILNYNTVKKSKKIKTNAERHKYIIAEAYENYRKRMKGQGDEDGNGNNLLKNLMEKYHGKTLDDLNECHKGEADIENDHREKRIINDKLKEIFKTPMEYDSSTKLAMENMGTHEANQIDIWERNRSMNSVLLFPSAAFMQNIRKGRSGLMDPSILNTNNLLRNLAIDMRKSFVSFPYDECPLNINMIGGWAKIRKCGIMRLYIDDKFKADLISPQGQNTIDGMGEMKIKFIGNGHSKSPYGETYICLPPMVKDNAAYITTNPMDQQPQRHRNNPANNILLMSAVNNNDRNNSFTPQGRTSIIYLLNHEVLGNVSNEMQDFIFNVLQCDNSFIRENVLGLTETQMAWVDINSMVTFLSTFKPNVIGGYVNYSNRFINTICEVGYRMAMKDKGIEFIRSFFQNIMPKYIADIRCNYGPLNDVDTLSAEATHTLSSFSMMGMDMSSTVKGGMYFKCNLLRGSNGKPLEIPIEPCMGPTIIACGIAYQNEDLVTLGLTVNQTMNKCKKSTLDYIKSLITSPIVISINDKFVNPIFKVHPAENTIRQLSRNEFVNVTMFEQKLN